MTSQQKHTIFKCIRDTEANKLKPKETVSFIAILPEGIYQIKVENHDILAGPTLNVLIYVTQCDDSGTKTTLKHLVEQYIPRLGSKINIFEPSTAQVEFKINKEQAPVLLELSVNNDGSLNRGCKTSIYVNAIADISKVRTSESDLLLKRKAYIKKGQQMEETLEDDEIPSHFICPITFEVMKEPVFCSDGFTYEKHAIIDWLKDHSTSPLTGVELKSKELTPNYSLKSAIIEYIEKRQKKKSEQKSDKEKVDDEKN